MRITRRTFLGSAMVAACAAGAVPRPGRYIRTARGVAAAKAASVTAGTSTAATNAAWWMPASPALTLPLDGARIVAVHPLRSGALPVVIEHAGARFQVDVFRKEAGGVAGVIESDHLSFFVQNAGDGSAATGEARELGARALSLALRNADEASLSRMLSTFRERASVYGDGFFDVTATQPSVA